jgi:hypothetical protein
MKWKGHHVYAVDGSTFTLPHSKEIKAGFPDIGAKATKTHYPKARVVLATHVLSGVPKSLRVDDQYIGERELFQAMLCDIEDDSILLLDRGFDGIASLNRIIESKKLFLCRLRADFAASKEVYGFAQSKRKETTVTLKNKHKETITVRLLKYKKDRHGKSIVLATNLFEKNTFTRTDLWTLYSRRWDIETSYYRVKKLFNIENFHAKNLNGVLQEIWANLIVLGMTSYLVLTSWRQKMKDIVKAKKAPNFKNASVVFKKYFVLLLFPSSPAIYQVAIDSISKEITAVHFNRQFCRKNPRISKQSLATWIGGRKNRPKDRLGRTQFRRGIYA